MGVWALEFNPGMAGSIYKMFYFNGDIFGVGYGAAGRGIWRRTPPNWTRHFAAVGGGRACVWDGQMWAGDGAVQDIHRSLDGVTWVQDWVPPGFVAWDHWSAFNAYEDYLRVGCRACQDGLTNHFWRRDKAGNWTETPVDQADINHFYDILNFGGRTGNDDIYLSAQASDVYRWSTDYGIWLNEPTLDNVGAAYFTEHQGTLYASLSGQVWRRSRYGEWVLDMADLGVGWDTKAISVGGDDVLYLAAEDGVNSRVYVRVGGHWVLHSTAAGVRFHSVVADAAGNLYAGTNACQFWAYAADFALAPGGLPPQAMDVDGDGDALYVCAYNAAAQPVLVKVALPLVNNAMGNAVFNPLAGTAISVKCGDVGGELAISGRLSAVGNDSVQVSEDGGGSWTDIAPNWADTAEPLLVDPDDAANAVMVALAGAQDITETFDGGGTWTVNTPAPIGYAPAAMARLPEGDELVIGDAHAARKVEYSPNRGVEIQDITGGAAIGNVTALEVA